MTSGGSARLPVFRRLAQADRTSAPRLVPIPRNPSCEPALGQLPRPLRTAPGCHAVPVKPLSQASARAEPASTRSRTLPCASHHAVVEAERGRSLASEQVMPPRKGRTAAPQRSVCARRSASVTAGSETARRVSASSGAALTAARSA